MINRKLQKLRQEKRVLAEYRVDGSFIVLYREDDLHWVLGEDRSGPFGLSYNHLSFAWKEFTKRVDGLSEQIKHQLDN